VLYSVEPPDAEPLLDRQEREGDKRRLLTCSTPKLGSLDMLQPAALLQQRCSISVQVRYEHTDFGAGISCAASIALDPYTRPLSLGQRSIGQQRGSIVCMVYGDWAQQR
jgi:hypothetical protein